MPPNCFADALQPDGGGKIPAADFGNLRIDLVNGPAEGLVQAAWRRQNANIDQRPKATNT